MMGSGFELTRGKSKRQVKNEQTKELYKDITTALHEKVGEFVANQACSDDDDDGQLEVYQQETNKKFDELTRILQQMQQEVEERKLCERDLLGRCEMLNNNMMRGHGDLKQALEDEARERSSLQRQLSESCESIAQAIEASQRQQPRGMDELRNMVLRLEENCKRMDTSIREDLRRMLLEDARTRNTSDPRLEDLIRKMHERDQLLGEVRSAVQDQAKQRNVLERRFEECFDEFGRQVAAVERAASQPKALEEAKAKWRMLEERCDRTDKVLEQHRNVSMQAVDDLKRFVQDDARQRGNTTTRLEDIQRVVQERDRLHDRFVGDVRATIQEQDQQRNIIERRFQDRCDQLGKQLAVIEGALPQQEALEESKSKLRWLEQRCDRLEIAPVEAVDDLRRLVQDEARQRSSTFNRLEDLDRFVRERDQVHERFVGDVRSVVQDQDQQRRVTERRFQEHFDNFGRQLADMEHASLRPEAMEEAMTKWRQLDQRCDSLDTALANNKTLPVEALDELRRFVQDEARQRGSTTNRLEDLQCAVQRKDQFFKDLAQEVRSASQEQAQLKSDSERHFEKLHKAITNMEHEAVRPMLQPLEETKSMLGWLEQRCDCMEAAMRRQETGPMDAMREVTRLVEAESLKRGKVTERLEERCDRLTAAVDSLGDSCQRDVAPRSLCEELRGLYKKLEERCDLMDASVSNRQAAMSKPAEELRRLLQDEMSRRNNKERRIDDRCDQIESTLLALQAAPAQFAAKNTNNINSVHDRIDNLEAILRDSTKRIHREESRSSGKGSRLNDKYATLAMDLKLLRGEANQLDTSRHGTRELEERLDQITRQILDDQAKLGKQANEQIANAIQGISRVESQLRASAFDPPSRNNSVYITDEWRTSSTAAPSERASSPLQMVSPAMSPTIMTSPTASPTQMVSPQMASRSPPKGMGMTCLERLPGVSTGGSMAMSASAGQLPQVSPQQMASPQIPQMASPQIASRSPPPPMVRGWAREVRPSMYTSGL